MCKVIAVIICIVVVHDLVVDASLADDKIVTAIVVSGVDEALESPRHWRDIVDGLPSTSGPQAELGTLPRLLEWLEMASGGRRVFVRQYSADSTCDSANCSGSLYAMMANTSDISLFYHHVTPVDAIHVDHLWRVGVNDIALMTLRSNLLVDQDVFLHQKHLLAGSCLIILIIAISLSVAILLTRRGRLLKKVAAWYIEILSQQGSHYLWNEVGETAKFLMFGGLFVSLICFNLFTARLASDIALRELDNLSLESMNELDYKLILGKGQHGALTTKNNPVIRALFQDANFVQIIERQSLKRDKTFVAKNSAGAVKRVLRGTHKAFMLARVSFAVPFVPAHERHRIAMSIVHLKNNTLNRLVR